MSTAPISGRPRIVSLDMLRGAALLSIFLVHVPGNPLADWTLRGRGYADAAEAFVLLAGISAGLIARGFLRDDRPGAVLAWSLQRAGKLYVAHLALFFAVAILLASCVDRTGNPVYFEIINIAPFFRQTAEAMPAAAMLTYQPQLLDILPLYIVLMAALPLIAIPGARWPLPVLAASLGLYVFAGLSGANLPGVVPGSGWTFDPLAWQALFTIGVLGALRGETLCAVVRGSRPMRVAALTYLGFAFLTSGPDLARIVEPDVIGPVDKTTLSPLRLADILAVGAVLIVLAQPLDHLARGLVGRALCRCGAHSLPVFAAGVLLALTCQVLLMEFEAPGLVWLLSLLGCVLLMGLGALLEAARRTVKPVAAAVPATATGRTFSA